MSSELTHPKLWTPWPEDVSKTVAMDETGLGLGLGTRLTRLTKDGRLAIEDDSERILALLSVAGRRPVVSEVLGPTEAAALHWRRGDKALANLRLAFAGLPCLTEPADAWRLRLAEALLDGGLPPRTLMAELGFDPSDPDFGKFGYNPNQPRVPAGNGRDSGRWGAFWARVASWLEEPVPEYDTDTGTEVGTRTRGRAIATNPLAIVAAGAAALAGGEALIGGEALVGTTAIESANGINIAERVTQLQQAIPAAQQGRITMAVGLAEDATGAQQVIIGTSEPLGYLRPGVTINPGEILAKGLGHAEVDVLDFARQNNLNLLEIGASRPICPSCASIMQEAGVKTVTSLRAPR